MILDREADNGPGAKTGLFVDVAVETGISIGVINTNRLTVFSHRAGDAGTDRDTDWPQFVDVFSDFQFPRWP